MLVLPLMILLSGCEASLLGSRMKPILLSPHFTVEDNVEDRLSTRTFRQIMDNNDKATD